MNHPVIDIKELGFPWFTLDPFLFCVHHHDAYPSGNEEMGPDRELLLGRHIGQDFAGKDGWNMYHGDVIPGFPAHPHRGFETITVVRHGYVDHADSLGATARFGPGDVQWMTAGKGIVHSEMFPLRERDRANPLELFQIWLNLPRKDKFAEPYFSMYWGEDIKTHVATDEQGKKTSIRVLAGGLADTTGVKPPPESWASYDEAGVAILTIKMQAGAQCKLPSAKADANRMLYFFVGDELAIDGKKIPPYKGVHLKADAEVVVTAGSEDCELLLLQGRPIGEPVAQYGPFVMNNQQEIQEAMMDYQRTGFGGWPWPTGGPAHDRAQGRFAKHADGRVEYPT